MIDNKLFEEFQIKGNEWLELKYNSIVEFKDFNYEILSLYLDDDQNLFNLLTLPNFLLL
ncbi:MAG: hypothetical protein KatS3mg083_036 [Candidatus Dojkabacteria bacterium]|nr:MAG: hypothetical protein KatS3mg083_036 [Candidatus Dojkabacteria bacterium]